MAHTTDLLQPRSLLGLTSLATGTEFILLTQALNKLTALYGILALLTGYPLNSLQVTHYLYSLLILGLVAWLHPAIRQSDGILETLALAWIYVFDTFISAVYTVLFGAGWFVVLVQHADEPVPVLGGGGVERVSGDGTVVDITGLMGEKINVSGVEIAATRRPGVGMGQHVTAYAGPVAGSLWEAVLQSSSVVSISAIIVLWIIRVYFCIVILSFARISLQRYLAVWWATQDVKADDLTVADNPFCLGGPDGVGMRGRLGRLMTRWPSKSYWYGAEHLETESLRGFHRRFGSVDSAKTTASSSWSFTRGRGRGRGRYETRPKNGARSPPLRVKL